MAPCIVICHFPLPAPSEEQLIEIAKKSAPKFRQLGGRGLISKDYVRNEHGAGGVYVWDSRAAYAHVGIDLQGEVGGTVRIADLRLRDVTRRIFGCERLLPGF